MKRILKKTSQISITSLRSRNISWGRIPHLEEGIKTIATRKRKSTKREAKSNRRF
jgi:hypothetical protein